MSFAAARTLSASMSDQELVIKVFWTERIALDLRHL